MRKTITILALLLATLTITISASASQLYLRTYAYNTKAVIGGNQFMDRSGEIFAGNLRPGNHYLTVRKIRGYNNRNHRHFGHNGLLFRGRIFIPANSIVYARLNRQGRLIIDEIMPMRRGKRGNGYHRGHGQRQPDYRRDHRNRDPYNRGLGDREYKDRWNDRDDDRNRDRDRDWDDDYREGRGSGRNR